MGGSSKETTNTSQLMNQLQQATQSGSQSQNQFGSQTGTQMQSATPWAATSGLLTSILGKVGSVPSGVTAAEDVALNQLSGIAGGGNPYAPAIGGVATELLGGGTDRTPIGLDAYNRYLAALTPTAGGAYTDPNTNPFFAKTTETIGNDVESRIKAMYAGSGRDPAGAGNYAQTLGRGIGEATAPIYADVYNRERTNQLGAAGNLYGAGNTTSGLLSSLDQSRLANKQAGIGAADAANTARMWGPLQMLQIESQRRGIPLQTLAAQYGMVLPAAQAFGTTSGQTAGQSSESASGQSYGSSTGTTTGSSSGTSTKETQPNMWNQIIGGSIGGLGALGSSGAFGSAGWLAPLMFSDARVKEDIAPVGELYDGSPVYSFRYTGDATPRIGLMAQDVEQTRPDAVTEISGIKAVDYGRATEHARHIGGWLSNLAKKVA